LRRRGAYLIAPKQTAKFLELATSVWQSDRQFEFLGGAEGHLLLALILIASPKMDFVESKLNTVTNARSVKQR
jgi:hypothetical protein